MAQALADVSSDEDVAISLALPADASPMLTVMRFTLSATLSNGSPLPTWLNFDGSVFTGTPPQDFNGSLDLAVTASDGELSVTDAFTLTIDPVNDAPVLVQQIADQSALGDEAVSFTIPDTAFADVDGDVLSYSAALSDGSALPSWLSFDASTLSFDGTAPNEDAVLDIELTANDGALFCIR